MNARELHINLGFCESISDTKDWCIMPAKEPHEQHMSLHHERDSVGNYNVFWTDEDKTPTRELK